jgi:hypothetical protein
VAGGNAFAQVAIILIAACARFSGAAGRFGFIAAIAAIGLITR